MKAAVSHAPIDHNGRQKFVFFALPHIGISDKGLLGEVPLFSFPVHLSILPLHLSFSLSCHRYPLSTTEVENLPFAELS